MSIRHKNISLKTIAILTALREGGTPREVAAAFKVSYTYVWQLRQKYNVQSQD